MSLTLVSLEEVKSNRSKRELELVNSLSEKEKEFIKSHFVDSAFGLYMPTFKSLESKEISKMAKSLVRKGIAYFDKRSGYDIMFSRTMLN